MLQRNEEQVKMAYEAAKVVYANFGTHTDQVITDFKTIPISLHCWQGDDVHGFENIGDVVSQNLVTGNYPGCST